MSAPKAPAAESAVPATPATGLAALREGWKRDLIAGFSVSLIALPLCLGIALASGVPPMAGLIAAIVGGLLASRITGSFVTISGPAAGLIVVTLGAVESMGAGDAAAGYRYALAAIVVAGVLQLGLGLLRVGKLGDFFPSSAVHGMLAAIGVIIIVKQVFVALGVSARGHELYEVIADVPRAILAANPIVALIAAISLVVLIVHPSIKWKPIKAVPGPMWVLLVAVPLGFAFDLSHEHAYAFAGGAYTVGPSQLVQLPHHVLDGIVLPDFSLLGTGVFWIAAASICLVSSIESLLSAAAVDTLDRFKRKSNLDRDLGVMGLGSALSGLIGGLPMISEIVRSSANINSGARTQWANFFHGGFLLAYLLVGTVLIEHIPLAALAAMLIHVGYKLTSLEHFRHAWQIGKAQLVIFCVTLITVLATDLIIGIAVGIATKLAIHLIYGTKPNNIFSVHARVIDHGDQHIVKLTDALVFTNYLSLKKKILATAVDGHTVLDFEEVALVDHTSLDHIQALVRELNDTGRECEIRNLESLRPVSKHPLATRISIAPGAAAGAHPPEVELSEREEALRALATEMHLDHRPIKNVAEVDWNRFERFRGERVVYEDNRIEGHLGDASIVFADLSISSGGRAGRPAKDISAVRIREIGDDVPDFLIQAEVASDKVAAWVGYDDIDFASNAQFSDRYLLRGRDAAAIRAWFGPRVLSVFVDAQTVFRVEARDGEILITSRDACATPAEAEGMLAFADLLCSSVADSRDDAGAVT